ncbi:hypothetical protein ASE01_05190 [Nocardioides sp. Root190]|uniref:hypothetical protein n=1 Tax=Nocardioides sp. Root190 TaxID=1736488 RepID=UPI0006F35F57|nr:hypothetical protein [Nocardioides sp. Root190]KRB78646.1 hypothetical protein ASE01_05190 [Nocardioides sp. Root190]
MSKDQQPRPGQATLAGVLIIGGSVFVVLAAWQRIATLHTIEAQEQISRMLGDGDYGLTVDGMATTLRILCLVGAGAATASTILGFQVFRRSTSARLVLTGLSPLLFVGGLATEQFLAPMVLAGIVLLWLQPTRDWYAGRPWVQRYEERRAARLAAMRSSSPTVPTDGTPAPDPFATPPTQPAVPTSPVPPAPHPAGQQLAPAPRARRLAPRPAGLMAACILAWVTSTAVVAGLALTALVVAQQSDDLYAEMQSQRPELMKSSGFSESDLVWSVYVVLGGLVLWALAAIVLAGLTFVGHNWARITLVVSAACAALVTLVMCLAAPPLVVMVLLLTTGGWLLVRPEVSAWFRR